MHESKKINEVTTTRKKITKHIYKNLRKKCVHNRNRENTHWQNSGKKWKNKQNHKRNEGETERRTNRRNIAKDIIRDIKDRNKQMESV